MSGVLAPRPKPPWVSWLLVAGLVVLLFVISPFLLGEVHRSTALTYTGFLHHVEAGKVSTATISATGAVTGNLVGGAAYTSTLPTALPDPNLSTLMLHHNVNVTAVAPSTSSFGSVLLFLLPYALIIGMYLAYRRYVRRVQGTTGGVGGAGGGGSLGALMGVGRSRAKVYDEDRPTTRFSDVAGYVETKQEVMEVVDFLKHPERYARAGATGPKGVLMVGPPGTGKTLMARAVAGEAGVPFFALSGSSFVEMFVGVGASRVRSLFEDARKRSPSIIFIDEIDAIGSRRGAGSYGGNDEREQTINQLLSEMDGFEPGSKVVLIAATNRAENLDQALMRPGRFDRTVEIPLPDQVERTQILSIHTRGKTLAGDVDLDVISRGTPGFSGADLANLANEAAINAVRLNRVILEADDFDTARDRLLLGHRSSTSVLLPEEKYATAVHETGHALVALFSQHADPVAKVTILPRGAALGVTEQLPVRERHLYSVSYLTDSLAVRLGGRAAELVVLGEASTGAANDLDSATSLAVRMVREWGLSRTLGPVGYGSAGPDQANPFGTVPYAEQTQRVIDEEVAALLKEAEVSAIDLLREHRVALDNVVALLLDRETIGGEELAIAAGHTRPTRPAECLPRAPAETALVDGGPLQTAAGPLEGLSDRQDT